MTDAQEYFNRLSGGDFDSINMDSLSSAQRSRFLAWCSSKGLNPLLDEENTNLEQATLNVVEPRLLVSIGSHKGLGIDIQDIGDLFPSEVIDYKTDDFLISIFNQKEIAYAEAKPIPRQTLAGLFAAKEAVIKASNNPALTIASIAVEHDSNGQPFFSDFQISISHSNNYAIAVAFNYAARSDIGGSDLGPDIKKISDRLSVIESMPDKGDAQDRLGLKMVIGLMLGSAIVATLLTIAISDQNSTINTLYRSLFS